MLLFVIIMLLLSKSKGVTAMLYPQILSAHTKDLVHVTPAMRIIPNTIAYQIMATYQATQYSTAWIYVRLQLF